MEVEKKVEKKEDAMLVLGTFIWRHHLGADIWRRISGEVEDNSWLDLPVQKETHDWNHTSDDKKWGNREKRWFEDTKKKVKKKRQVMPSGMRLVCHARQEAHQMA